jgi:DNA-binding response OmpR family regulator
MPGIVIIEDDRAIAQPLVRVLEGLGYSVSVAFDCVSGLADRNVWFVWAN